jgi:hypothetical protein
VTGVDKREIKIPIEIQKQAVDLDEEMFGVAAPAVGPAPWQRQPAPWQRQYLGGFVISARSANDEDDSIVTSAHRVEGV